jgi:putative ABC transport system substrate-binding protein
MRRREFLTALVSATAAWPIAARGQQPSMPVIGYLGTGSARDSLEMSAFRQGLGEASFFEGNNVAIEYRITEDYSRMPALAVELVQRQVAVIVAISTPAALAAKAATTTIPIVFAIGDDPVRFGLVAALNRPGGNATGVNVVAIDLEAMRMGTLRELVPAAGTIGVLVNPKNPNAAKQSDDVRGVARTIERQIYILNAEDEQEIHAAFTTLTQRRIGALAVTGDTFFAARRSQIVTLAAHYAIPTIYQRREFTEAGGLISYGTDFGPMLRQSGLYVGRILKGTRAAELPVLQPTKFELVINLKTAKTLGLDVPDKLLALADEVID